VYHRRRIVALVPQYLFFMTTVIYAMALREWRESALSNSQRHRVYEPRDVLARRAVR
jgi:hypothetical protein